MHRVRALLEDPWTRPVLWALQLLAIAVMMWSTRNEIFGDHASYLQLAEGILHGEYSHYWQLDVPVPDTFRTPGFPLYIAAVMTVFGSWKAIMWIHLALYLLAIHLTLRIIARFDPRSLAGNLALLFLLPLVNVPYYITQLSPEIPTLAAITTVIYLLVRKDRLSWVDAIALGLLYGFIFQCRPIYLWLPPVIAIATWWARRTAFDKRGHLVALSLFALTLLPYGFGTSSTMACSRSPRLKAVVVWYTWASGAVWSQATRSIATGAISLAMRSSASRQPIRSRRTKLLMRRIGTLSWIRSPLI